MSKSNYGGALMLKDINRNVTTPLPKEGYQCPAGHTIWTDSCASCHTIYGDHNVSR